MAIFLARFKILSKPTSAAAFFSFRSSCNLSKFPLKPRQHSEISTNTRARLYFTSITNKLRSPEKFSKTAGKKTSYAYDVNINVPENVLLYTDGNRRHFYGLIQVLSVGAFLTFMLIGDTIRVVLKHLKAAPPATDGEPIKWYQWWKKLSPGGRVTSNLVFFLISTAGLVLCIFGHVYPARMVCSVWLLSGGRTVSLSTYQSLGRIKTTKYPLKEISCESDPVTVDRFIPFKIKGKYLYFLVDKKKGTFYNEKLFKGCLALKREF